MKQKLIAEVKTKSPFHETVLNDTVNDFWEMFEFANRYGDIISIHTDPRWGGSKDLIKAARKITSKPILAKGIHENDYQIAELFDIGVDYVLVVGRIPDCFDFKKILIEPLCLCELKKLNDEKIYPKELSKDFQVVWNARNIVTGECRGGYREARKIWKGWLCQASMIRNAEDIQSDADAILVGTFLENIVEGIKIGNND